jgi:hypothetical protein
VKQTPDRKTLFVEPKTKKPNSSWWRAGDKKSNFQFGSIPTKFEKTG